MDRTIGCKHPVVAIAGCAEGKITRSFGYMTMAFESALIPSALARYLHALYHAYSSYSSLIWTRPS